MNNPSAFNPDSNHPAGSNANHSIGAVIRKYRKHSGLTQSGLAEKMELHKNTIFAWENDIQMPSLEKATELCRILHMPIQELSGVYEGADIARFHSDPLAQNLNEYFNDLPDHDRVLLVNIAETMVNQQKQEREQMLRNDIRLFEHSVTKAAAGTGSDYGDIPVNFVFLKKNAQYQKADAVFTVEGHSMEPRYRDTDMVYVRFTQEVPDGRDVICRSNDGQLIKRKQGDRCVSLNPDPRYVLHKSEDDHVEIIGEVLGIVNPSDIIDSSLYPELEDIHAREIRQFNRKHNIED